MSGTIITTQTAGKRGKLLLKATAVVGLGILAYQQAPKIMGKAGEYLDNSQKISRVEKLLEKKDYASATALLENEELHWRTADKIELSGRLKMEMASAKEQEQVTKQTAEIDKQIDELILAGKTTQANSLLEKYRDPAARNSAGARIKTESEEGLLERLADPAMCRSVAKTFLRRFPQSKQTTRVAQDLLLCEASQLVNSISGRRPYPEVRSILYATYDDAIAYNVKLPGVLNYNNIASIKEYAKTKWYVQGSITEGDPVRIMKNQEYRNEDYTPERNSLIPIGKEGKAVVVNGNEVTVLFSEPIPWKTQWKWPDEYRGRSDVASYLQSELAVARTINDIDIYSLEHTMQSLVDALEPGQAKQQQKSSEQAKGATRGR